MKRILTPAMLLLVVLTLFSSGCRSSRWFAPFSGCSDGSCGCSDGSCAVGHSYTPNSQPTVNSTTWGNTPPANGSSNRNVYEGSGTR